LRIATSPWNVTALHDGSDCTQVLGARVHAGADAGVIDGQTLQRHATFQSDGAR
jgi:hypothetical protein